MLQTKFPSFLEKSPASKYPARKKRSLVLARQVLDKKHSDHSVKPASRAQRLDENYGPLGTDARLWRKNLLKQLKNENCWKIINKESKRLLLKIT